MSSIIKTDVTAVKLMHDKILAGIGSFVHVYNKETGELLQQICTLHGQKIYGFTPITTNSEVQKIIVFGGKQFTVAIVKYEPEFNLVILFDAIICDDWIHCAVWISEDSVSNVIAVLSAHNTVEIWNVDTQSILSTHTSIENSILYSGLLVPLCDDLLVLSGTVYSEVLIRLYRNESAVLRLKGHRGVILYIACNIKTGLIVTTSDDRSLRIWGPTNSLKYNTTSKLYWENVQMDCKHEVYGHTARVMRCAVSNDIIASVGEDSKILIWTYKGKLIGKKPAHQNGTIWSIDIDKHNNMVTGGGDAGIIFHPKSSVNYHKEIEILDLKIQTPKKILYTARNNIVLLNKNEILYYDEDLKTVTTKFEIKFESTYILMDISSCKQLISICDMLGNFNMFIENCKGEPCVKRIIQTKLEMGKILSMHWAGNRYIVFCCSEGEIKLLAANGTELTINSSFILPNCKERWLTSCAFDNSKNLITVGDRCGNIHFYIKGVNNPLKTFSKVHGAYGPTSLKINNNEIVSTGRDGTAKYFNFDENENKIKYLNAKNLTFEWVERQIDKKSKYICGFRERAFVVYDMVNNAEILQVPCGGGHRPWDVLKYIEKTSNGYKEFIRIVFLKSPEIYEIKYNLDDIVSKHLVKGTHSKEINCLNTLTCSFDPNTIVNVSGGEDTTLRASIFSKNLQPNETESVNVTEEIIQKHLSNVRTLKTVKINDDKHLVVSAGGRAQICTNIIEIKQSESNIKLDIEQIANYMIKGTDKQRKGTKSWKEHEIDFDPETRVMDLDIKQIDNNIYHIYAGCSDALLRIYELNLKLNSKENLKPVKEIIHHKTCILKVVLVKDKTKDILVTCTTRGIVSFWDTNRLKKDSDGNIKPFFETQTNKAGINSVDTKILSEKRILLATGGDDNAIHLSEIVCNKSDDLKADLVKDIVIDNWHSSQVTGIKFVDDNLLLSTSVDQRVTLSKWRIDQDKLTCTFLKQYCSDVADIHGLSIVSNLNTSIDVCVFGKGYEVLNVLKENE